jgi:hypothetical protein
MSKKVLKSSDSIQLLLDCLVSAPRFLTNGFQSETYSAIILDAGDRLALIRITIAFFA